MSPGHLNAQGLDLDPSLQAECRQVSEEERETEMHPRGSRHRPGQGGWPAPSRYREDMGFARLNPITPGKEGACWGSRVDVEPVH